MYSSKVGGIYFKIFNDKNKSKLVIRPINTVKWEIAINSYGYHSISCTGFLMWNTRCQATLQCSKSFDLYKGFGFNAWNYDKICEHATINKLSKTVQYLPNIHFNIVLKRKTKVTWTKPEKYAASIIWSGTQIIDAATVGRLKEVLVSARLTDTGRRRFLWIVTRIS